MRRYTNIQSKTKLVTVYEENESSKENYKNSIIKFSSKTKLETIYEERSGN